MRHKYLLPALVLCVLILGQTIISAASFQFNLPEKSLVEPAFESFLHENPDVVFDAIGNVHVVYEDNRNASNTHIFGTTYTLNGDWTPSYRAYQGVNSDPHIHPFVVPSLIYADQSYVSCLNSNGTTWKSDLGALFTATLPFPPSTSDLTSYSMSSTGSISYDVIAANGYIFYVCDSTPNLLLNKYDETGSWIGETTIYPDSTEELQFPKISIDDAGYIYLLYRTEDVNSYHLKIRRSSSPYDVSSFHMAHDAAWNSTQSYNPPALAVTGDSGSMNLKVAIAYLDPTGTVTKIIGDMDDSTDWTETSPLAFGNYGPYDISSTLVPAVLTYGPDMEYDAAGTLYYVWSDDRDSSFKIYGNTSYDGGISVLPADEVSINDSASNLTSAPKLATGPLPGDIAIAYCRMTSNANPYLLVSRATFFDSCNAQPAATGYWDSYAGVSSDSGFSSPYSPPSVYKFENGKSKGLLQHNYANLMQGSVTLQFFDTMSTTENFYVALENNNSKGVIRMLGVRNETTQTNYCYSFDGLTWTDMGAPRTPGWHEIRMAVDDYNLTMQIESGSKQIYDVTDPTFTSFTSIEMNGGSSASPYYIDDVRVEAFEIDGGGSTTVPAVSTFSMAILIVMFSLLFLFNRKKLLRNS